MRPVTCPDKKCKMIGSCFDPRDHKQGYSFHCVGCLPSPIEIVWHKSTHRNDMSLCIHSPMSGTRRVLTNKDDLVALVELLQKAVSYI